MSFPQKKSRICELIQGSWIDPGGRRQVSHFFPTICCLCWHPLSDIQIDGRYQCPSAPPSSMLSCQPIVYHIIILMKRLALHLAASLTLSVTMMGRHLGCSWHPTVCRRAAGDAMSTRLAQNVIHPLSLAQDALYHMNWPSDAALESGLLDESSRIQAERWLPHCPPRLYQHQFPSSQRNRVIKVSLVTTKDNQDPPY